MVNHELTSPCRTKYNWWGAYQEDRESIFKECYSTLLEKSQYYDDYSSELAKWCSGSAPSVTTIDPINVLKTVSIYHASATFTGARLTLNGLTSLALGMMQHGATMKADKWDSWKTLLPTMGADDFTAWWVFLLSLGYATGETDGPYLLDPDGYYHTQKDDGTYKIDLPSDYQTILQNGFAEMEALGTKLYNNTNTCDFKPTWYYAPDKAVQSMTTMTSGTYV